VSVGSFAIQEQKLSAERETHSQAMSSPPSAPLDKLDLQRDGAMLVSRALDATSLALIEDVLAGLPAGQAGIRLFGVEGLRPILQVTGAVGAIATPQLGKASRPVRAILFDKSAEANWSLAWHQDRVIAVRERIDVIGFGPWTRKFGVPHVAPPFSILSRMLTLRLHLDAVTLMNAPLLIAPGSHRLGRIAEADVPTIVRDCGPVACLASAGDVWLYSTPILHASEAALRPVHRRVLQVDYAACDLPGGLEWLGV
jgi:hypothetical protein